jgi:CelD/BcsL family acetyltransferase involved in cellulose biosynthesis
MLLAVPTAGLAVASLWSIPTMATAWRWNEPALLAPPSRAKLGLRWPLAVDLRPVTIAVISQRADFDALEAEWNDLFDRAGRDAQLFQTFNWNWHWANHYLQSARRTLAIVTVRQSGRLVMLWPLLIERSGGLKVLRWMGEPVSQYGDVLAENAADTPALMRQAWRFLTEDLGADAIFLRKVRADAVIAPLLAEVGLLQTASAQAPCLDLGDAPDFARYETRYSGKARKNRRRLMRRMSEHGAIEVVRHDGGPGARAAALEAIALKAKWIKTTGRLSAALADQRFAAFFADVADGRGRPAGCRLTVLKTKGETAGIAIDVTSGKHRAAHVIVHDPALDSFSPGTLLLQEWIRGACADGIATFDLLAPAYAYKLDWADRSVAVGDHAQGLTFAGRSYVRVFLGLVRPRLKAAAEALPQLLEPVRAMARLLRPRGKPAVEAAA